MEEDEEKSPKASSLTLTEVLKTPAEGEEVERIRKRKRTEEQPREIAPIVEAEEEFLNEEMGGFEDYTEQPLLSPNAKETILTPISVEENGKKRVEV